MNSWKFLRYEVERLTISVETEEGIGMVRKKKPQICVNVIKYLVPPDMRTSFWYEE